MVEGVSQQEPAEPQITSILNSSSQLTPDINDFLEQNPSQPRLYIQRSATTGLNPLFTVKVPLLGFQYVLDSRGGLTQWFIEPIDKITAEVFAPDFTIDSAMRHQFFSQELVPVPWAVENVLVWLQRAYFSLPCQNITIPEDRRDHYTVNVLLTVGTGPDDTHTGFTRHIIAGDTMLGDLFEVLGGSQALGNDCAFVQYFWSGGATPLGSHQWYSKAVREQITFRDAGYIGNFLWLLPVRKGGEQDGDGYKQDGGEQDEDKRDEDKGISEMDSAT